MIISAHHLLYDKFTKTFLGCTADLTPALERFDGVIVVGRDKAVRFHRRANNIEVYDGISDDLEHEYKLELYADRNDMMFVWDELRSVGKHTRAPAGNGVVGCVLVTNPADALAVNVNIW